MKILILNGAPCLFDDMEKAKSLCKFDKIYATNQTPLHIANVDVWVSAHPENMPNWQALFVHKYKGVPLPEIVCSTYNTRGFPAKIDRTSKLRWEGQQSASAGSSALFAVKVALEDGASHVVVAGAPLDNSGHIGIVGGDSTNNYEKFRSGWDWAKACVLGNKVRAMSGYPAEILGKPSKYWLQR